jgi:hypothetical protein
MALTEMPDFQGKVIVLFIRSAPRGIEDGVVLDFASFKDVGGRIFVCGRVPELYGADWIHGIQAGTAWEDVAHYMIFNSLEEYRSKMEKSKPTLLQRLGIR